MELIIEILIALATIVMSTFLLMNTAWTIIEKEFTFDDGVQSISLIGSGFLLIAYDSGMYGLYPLITGLYILSMSFLWIGFGTFYKIKKQVAKKKAAQSRN